MPFLIAECKQNRNDLISYKVFILFKEILIMELSEDSFLHICAINLDDIIGLIVCAILSFVDLLLFRTHVVNLFVYFGENKISSHV